MSHRPADLLDETAYLFGRFATSSTHLFHENMVFTSLDFLNNCDSDMKRKKAEARKRIT